MNDCSVLIEQLDKIFASIDHAETLLIVPPFIRLNGASHGVHILQACAQANGHKVSILYANMLFANVIGQNCYNGITFPSGRAMLGERVFARAAYNLPLLGKNAEKELADFSQDIELSVGHIYQLDWQQLSQAALLACEFADIVAKYVAAKHFKVVGFTTMFNQTGPSFALLNRIKRFNPDTLTIIGGANCAGDMAKGILSLSDKIDYVFSGECDSAFVQFLADLALGKRPELPIINGKRRENMDDIATPDFSAFYDQIDICQIDIDWHTTHIPYESSRGCWWGQKHHCTFCSVPEMNYRTKSAERVIEQLTELLAKHPSNYVNFTDDIMSLSYFKTLLPRLKLALPHIKFFIDQKASLSLAQVNQLVEAGAYNILPGIETLSTPLLKAVDKGTTARQNIQLMRYANSCGLYLSWFFLYGVPGEKVAHYQRLLAIVPLVMHLEPPLLFQPIELSRFGLYVSKPDAYGIDNVMPDSIYHQILPDWADIDNLAYYFTGDYQNIQTLAPHLAEQLAQLVAKWQQLWRSTSPPVLHVEQAGADRYLLTDTRQINNAQQFGYLNELQAATVLVGHPLNRMPENWPLNWAIELGYAIKQDQWLVPLATANPQLIEQLTAKYKPYRVDPKVDIVVV